MRVAGWLMLPGSDFPEGDLSLRERVVRLARGWVQVDAGRITEVALGKPPGPIELGGDDCVVMPGLIDTHLHLPQFRILGFDGLPLLEWLEQGVFPEEARWADADYATSRCDEVFQQLLSFGTTGIAAYATLHAKGTRVALEAAKQLGLRAAIGQVLMDRNAPTELMRPTDQLLQECTQLAAEYQPAVRQQPHPPKAGSPRGPIGSRVEYAVTPRFAITCTPELMRGAGQIAARHGSLVQTHLAETEPECLFVEQLFPGLTYTQVYEECGLLGQRTIMGHGIHLKSSERDLLRGTNTVIAHCPVANTFLQSGIMPRSRWNSEGLRLSLGSDIGAGTERSMIRTARAMIEMAKLARLENTEFTVPTAAEAWWQITAGNAAALGWHDCGKLAVGCEADLVIARPNIAWQHAPDPLAVLLYAWDDRWLQQTVLAGKVAFS
jgi:guanine deaminase